ncbi:DUF4339 domain-containing protein [Hyphomonas sp.]|uniref:DUF4339 domain-containing protein n=1 Tax=Hyphomonas sp. TaxID=87 RepID=UPI00391A7C74
MPLAPGLSPQPARGKHAAAGLAVVDLARVDPAVWHLLSGRKTFGPYTIGQLQQFAIEGRISPRSRVAQGETDTFRAVAEIPRLYQTLSDAFAERARRRAEASNYLIMARAPLPAEAALAAQMPGCLSPLGKSVMLMPGAWLLRTCRSMASVRAALDEGLPRHVQYVLMEAREGRLGWSGLGDELDDTVRTVWNAALTRPGEAAES